MEEGWPLSPENDDPDSAHIIYYFAEIIRGLLRAIAANDASGAIADTARLMRNLDEVLKQAPEKLTWYKIIEGAVDEFKTPPATEDSLYKYIDLARTSTKYLAELSTADGFSTARISKAIQRIEAEIKYLRERSESRVTRFD